MRTAIIDIGYNAIRAVVYNNNSIGAHEIFHIKFKNNILKLLSLENLNVKHSTYVIVDYLSHIFDKLSVHYVQCVATEVLRNHSRSNEFQKLMRDRFGIELQILSGKQESYLSSIGLMYGTLNANGIMIDLGGGSLEIAVIAKNKVYDAISLRLGTKIANKSKKTLEEITQEIKSHTTLSNKQNQNLYLIGGALRIIAKAYLDYKNIKVKFFHNFELNTKELLAYLEESIQTSNPILDKAAILTLTALINAFNPQKIIISYYGLKEGAYFKSLPQEARNKNIIYDKLRQLINIDDLSDYQFDKYHELAKDVLIDPNEELLEIMNFAILLTIYSYNFDFNAQAIDPGDLIFALNIPFSYKERIMLSTIMEHLNTKLTNKVKNNKICVDQVSHCNSIIISNILSIVIMIDGPSFKTPSFSFKQSNSYIEIVPEIVIPQSIFFIICKYIKNIARSRKRAANYKSISNV
ncbi:MAG: Ppx/GppA family phosphatase [Rickettsiaceae bacterium]